MGQMIEPGRSHTEPLSPAKWERGVGERGVFAISVEIEIPSPPAPLPQVGEGRPYAIALPPEESHVALVGRMNGCMRGVYLARPL